MKKTLLIIAVLGLAMASCKKDYTCKCTTTVNSGTPGPEQVTTLVKVKKSTAKDACRSYNIVDAPSTVGATTTDVKCTVS